MVPGISAPADGAGIRTEHPWLLRAVFIAAAAVWVFAPALHGDWLMDDDLYVTQNPLHGDPAQLWKIWFVPGSFIEYYPIEASAQALEWRLWGLNPFGYHIVSLLLHVANALLVWRLLGKLGLRLAWLGGLLFAIHPAVVESVAWISELKNTLSLAPFLLAMCAWVDYTERGRRADYVLALTLFLVAMLCKISMAAFPLVLLLYSWWRNGRVSARDLREIAPFLAISLVLGFLTIYAGNVFRLEHLQSPEGPPLGGTLTRVALAGTTLAFYFVKAVLPIDMIPIYPKWPVDVHHPSIFLPWLAAAALVLWLWQKRASWGRHALLGLGFFGLNLAPFLGFTSVTYMAFAWVMDHFLYLPLIGVVGLAVAVLGRLEQVLSAKTVFVFPTLVALTAALLMLESTRYVAIFAGPEKLWSYTIEKNPSCWLAYNNLGNVLFETGRIPEAIVRYEQALALNPAMVEAHNNLGRALAAENRTEEAVSEYRLALQYNSHFAITLVNLGDALAATGNVAEAQSEYEEALRVNPSDAATRAKLGKLQGQPPSATSATLHH